MMTLSLLTISLILGAMQEICLLLYHIREVIQGLTYIFEVPWKFILLQPYMLGE